VLAQECGALLFRRWYAQPDVNVMTLDDAKAVAALAYGTADELFSSLWKRLTLNERLVLTALSKLLYDNPLRPVDTAAMESWLVPTDYPLNATTINAAARSLEYREVVDAAPAGFTIHGGLLQRWLLENATAIDTPVQPARRGVSSRAVMLVAGALALLALGLLLLTFLSNTPFTKENVLPDPTVTLVGP
jgi:hypothetical protein